MIRVFVLHIFKLCFSIFLVSCSMFSFLIFMFHVLIFDLSCSVFLFFMFPCFNLPCLMLLFSCSHGVMLHAFIFRVSCFLVSFFMLSFYMFHVPCHISYFHFSCFHFSVFVLHVFIFHLSFVQLNFRVSLNRKTPFRDQKLMRRNCTHAGISLGLEKAGPIGESSDYSRELLENPEGAWWSLVLTQPPAPGPRATTL